MTTDRTVREAVRERYAEAAERAAGGGAASCCGGGDAGCGCGDTDPLTRDIYRAEELQGLPSAAASASLGCGNPTMLAELRPGEVVLDLGSGGGIDVLLSARRVGPTGKAYGVDMTDEMLELARRNQREMGVTNAEFLKGEIEDLPLPDRSVDVVISNCVINLSTDKARVLEEAYRVIRPGGRFAVADILVQGRLPDALKSDMEAWSGCLAGALHEDDYRALLAAAGFTEVEVDVVRTFAPGDLDGIGGSADAQADIGAGRFCSAFVRARKPL